MVVTFEDGLKKIPDRIMSNVKTLKAINMTGSVDTIGKSAFLGCEQIKSFSCTKSITSIEDNAFNGCTSLASVKLSQNLQHLGYYGFYNCKSLESINIPASLISISTSPFGNSGLKTVTFEYGTTSVISGMLRDAINLETVVIPETVTEIGTNAFYNCTSLKEIALPSKLKNIGSYAFYNSGLTSITVPQSVDTIGTKAIGYNFNAKVEDFTIYGYANTESHTYATENEINFVDISVSYEVGDVNLDGVVDVNDVTYLQMHLASYTNSDGSVMIDTTDADMFKITDTNADNDIDVNDVSYIQMMIAGLI